MQRLVSGIIVLLSAVVSACIPYTVGTTAQPVAPGKTTTAMMTYVMPSVSFDTTDRSPYRAHSNLAVDGELRHGLDDRSDIGLRAVGYSGIVVSYKRLLSDTASRVRVAVMPGAGIVNGGDHAYGEFTLLVSGHEQPTERRAENGTRGAAIVPYGGVRISKVDPIAQNAVRDEPTYGAFLGVRFGTTDFGVSPEIGVFHDHSALGVRRGDIVVVPAVVLHGTQLISIFRRLPRRFDASGPRGGERTGDRAPNDNPGVPILPPILLPQTPRPVWASTRPRPEPGIMRRPADSCSAPRRVCTATRRSGVTARPRP